MHPKRSRTRLEEILAEWDLDDNNFQPASTQSVTLSSQFSNSSITSPSTIYTTGTASTPWYTFDSNKASAKIQLDGEDADIQVNGWSLVAAVKRMEERLGLFQPNPELEQEWEDLRALGEQYRRLEQHIKDKQAVWDRLKAMPEDK